MGRALSARSCTGQTHVGAVSPRSTNQLHDGAMAGKRHSFAQMDLQKPSAQFFHGLDLAHDQCHVLLAPFG